MKPLLILLTALAALAHHAGARQPNFVIINIDDLGYADIGPYGSSNKTPHLDRMAREGRKLTSHYAAPVCSPSRAALMTGCYPKRALPIPHVLFPGAAAGLHPAERTIAEVLKEAGYTTGCIGKWHLGDQREFLPTAQGFDFYFGLPYSNDMGPTSDGAKSNFGQPLPQPRAPRTPGAPVDNTGMKGAGQPPLPLLENDKVIARVRADEQRTLTRQYTERAVRFIREQKEKPFFLYLPHTAVHFPLYPAQEHTGKSPHGLLGDWVEEVDASVGRVLETLRELGLAEQTLVVFTSDNGGVPGHGSSNQPLRGAKGQTFEGGIRVCTLAWWPGKIPPASSTDAITSMMDFFPTLTRLAGAKLPADRKLDGVDIWPVLEGDPGQPPRDHFFYYRGFTLEAVRSGAWKLHLALAEGGPGQKGLARPHLYHLADDLGEKKNVADENPAVVQRLQALAQTMAGDLGLEGVGPGCRPLGKAQNPQPLIGFDGAVREDVAGSQKAFP